MLQYLIVILICLMIRERVIMVTNFQIFLIILMKFLAKHVLNFIEKFYKD